MEFTWKLKAYGYPLDNEELDSPLRLNEVTFVADVDSLRKLAAFLDHAADLKEQHGANFGHEHFKDFCRGLPDDATDVIVSK